MKKLMILISASTLLASCGIKPKDVEPPSDIEQRSFPRTYPDMRTDPVPGGGQPRF